MPAFQPLINGINYSWANVKLVLFGVPVIGIKEISYKEKQEKKNNYGWGDKPISRGYGNYEYEASITLYLEEWVKIIDAAPNRNPLAIEPFDIPVIYGTSSLTARVDTLRKCEFMENPFEAKQGDSLLTVKIPLIIAAIDRN